MIAGTDISVGSRVIFSDQNGATLKATVETKKSRKGQVSVTTDDGVRRRIFVGQIIMNEEIA